MPGASSPTVRVLEALAAMATLIAAVIGIAKCQHDKPISIGTIKSSNPDFVEIVSTSRDSIALKGYRICEHDVGETKDSCCEIPDGSKVGDGDRMRVYFFSPKNPAKREEAAQRRDAGDIVCDQFGISAGEVLVLYDGDGNVIDKKTAS